MSRRSTTITKGSVIDYGTNSLISSRESSKNTDYYQRSAVTKLSPESIKLPPIKNDKHTNKHNKNENNSQNFENSVIERK